MNNKKEGFAMAKQRDPVLDSMRGIGIVLMVLGHAGFPGSSFIYLFHMALFFMLSGWFFSPYTGESAHRLARFAKRKVVTLWLPFVAANTVYTLLTNLFLKVNILTGDERILDLPGNLITTPVTIKDIIGRTAHWSVFDGGTQLGGAMWFIQALFQISQVMSPTLRVARSTKGPSSLPSGYRYTPIHVLLPALEKYFGPA